LGEKLHKKSCFAPVLCYIFYMKEHNIRLQKHAAARDWLRNYLMNLAPGSRLPGIREMTALSGVGRSILEKALLDAELDYLLVRRDRSGFFRSCPPPGKADVVIAVDNSNNQLEPVGSCRVPSYAARVATQLLNLASADGLKSHFTSDLENLPPDVPVFLLMPTASDVVKRIESQARTVVISGCGGKLWVKPPHSGNTAAGVEYLYNLGHRKIGFFYHTPEKIINPHLFAYYKFMAERGVKVYDHWLLEYGNNSDMAEKFRAALRHNIRPDSVLVPACWLPTVYEVLRQEKLLIPWHISILSIGQPPEDFCGEPYPAVLADNPIKLADRAWEVMFSDSTVYQEELAVEITNTSSVMSR
jgi:hypothetical protein